MWWGTQILAYAWYVFVESFGSLFPALFWAFASEITISESAKKGFPFIVAIGQLGSIVGPFLISPLSARLGHDTSALSLGIAACVIAAIIPAIRYFLRTTPHNLMESFHGKNEVAVEQKQEPGFFEGLKLLVSNRYLLCIFAGIFFFEVVDTIFDFHFQIAASAAYSGRALDHYLGIYGGCVNSVALICLLLGVSNITRLLGVGVALLLMPLIVGSTVLAFISVSSLTFLFIIKVGSKALNYALNGPAIKMLYIPTTHDVRFKAQAWIETFGSRGSKEAGSLFTMTYKPLVHYMGAAAGRAQHIMLTGYIGFTLVTLWFFTAFYLGKTYKKAIDEKRVIC
jgi:AAA family ATP:ADP antiporter